MTVTQSLQHGVGRVAVGQLLRIGGIAGVRCSYHVRWCEARSAKDVPDEKASIGAYGERILLPQCFEHETLFTVADAPKLRSWTCNRQDVTTVSSNISCPIHGLGLQNLMLSEAVTFQCQCTAARSFTGLDSARWTLQEMGRKNTFFFLPLPLYLSVQKITRNRNINHGDQSRFNQKPVSERIVSPCYRYCYSIYSDQTRGHSSTKYFAGGSHKHLN